MFTILKNGEPSALQFINVVSSEHLNAKAVLRCDLTARWARQKAVLFPSPLCKNPRLVALDAAYYGVSKINEAVYAMISDEPSGNAFLIKRKVKMFTCSEADEVPRPYATVDLTFHDGESGSDEIWFDAFDLGTKFCVGNARTVLYRTLQALNREQEMKEILCATRRFSLALEERRSFLPGHLFSTGQVNTERHRVGILEYPTSWISEEDGLVAKGNISVVFSRVKSDGSGKASLAPVNLSGLELNFAPQTDQELLARIESR